MITTFLAKWNLALLAIGVWRGSNVFRQMFLHDSLLYLTVRAHRRLAQIGTHRIIKRLRRGYLVGLVMLFGWLLHKSGYRASLVRYPNSCGSFSSRWWVWQSGQHLLLARYFRSCWGFFSRLDCICIEVDFDLWGRACLRNSNALLLLSLSNQVPWTLFRLSTLWAPPRKRLQARLLLFGTVLSRFHMLTGNRCLDLGCQPQQTFDVLVDQSASIFVQDRAWRCWHLLARVWPSQGVVRALAVAMDRDFELVRRHNF